MHDTPIYWVTPRLGVGPFVSPVVSREAVTQLPS